MSSHSEKPQQDGAKSKANSAKKSKSNPQWLKRHFDDFYVKEAHKKGYRSRAVFKLQEIQEKDHILNRGDVVVDLGAAPGGWSQLAREFIGPAGSIIAADILPMESLERVEFVQGDFTEPEVLEKILSIIGERRVQLVMSDMAPNISGVRAVDQPRSMYLAELALDLAQNVLSTNGDFLTKIFQGEGFDEYFRALKSSFNKVLTRKPKASRSNSREVYLLARGYKGN